MKVNWLKKTRVLVLAVAMLLVGVGSAFAATSSVASDKIYFGYNNKYYLFNNMWGSKAAGSGYQQTIYMNKYYNSNSACILGSNWNWPVGSSTYSVKAYPSIVYGWHWTSGYGTGTSLPVRLSDNYNVNTSVTYSLKSTGTYNAAYDLWFHDTNSATWSSKPTDELMIWLNNTNAGPAGSYVETATIGGTSWKVYKGWITSNSATGEGWNVYSFVRSSNTSSTTLNIKNFTDYIVMNKGWMSSSKYLSSVEFGNEIFWGTGGMYITKYSVSVSKN